MKTHTIVSVVLVMVCSLYSGGNWAHGHGGGGGWHGGGGRGGSWHGGGGGHFGHGGRFHGFFGGVYLGAPFYGYGYPYYGYPYYSPSVVTVPVAPQTYIQQAPVAQQYPAGYWYYCASPEGYYPYVKTCPNGWRQVSPLP